MSFVESASLVVGTLSAIAASVGVFFGQKAPTKADLVRVEREVAKLATIQSIQFDLKQHERSSAKVPLKLYSDQMPSGPHTTLYVDHGDEVFLTSLTLQTESGLVTGTFPCEWIKGRDVCTVPPDKIGSWANSLRFVGNPTQAVIRANGQLQGKEFYREIPVVLTNVPVRNVNGNSLTYIHVVEGAC